MTDLTPTQRRVLAAAVARPDRTLLPLPESLRGGAAKQVLAGLRARGLAAEAADGAIAATDAAFAALGLALPGAAPVDRPRRTRAGTKQARLVAMLEAPGGASIAEIAAALGWRHHTVRGAIAGTLRRKLGLDVTATTAEGRGTVYRIG